MKLKMFFEAYSVFENGASDFSVSLLAVHGANPELGSAGRNVLQELGVPV